MTELDTTGSDDFAPLEVTDILIEMLRGIVSHPEAVEVTPREEGNQIVLRITAHPSDCGQIIGRHGWMASMIRYYLGVYGAKTRQYYMTEIIGQDGRPQNPLPPLTVSDLENLQQNQQDNAGEIAIAAIEGLQQAFSAIEETRRYGGARRTSARSFRSRPSR